MQPITGFSGALSYSQMADWEAVFSLTTGKAALSYQNKKPALVENKIGKGKTFFFTEPAEMLLAGTPHAYANDHTHLIYSYLKKSAGIKEEIKIDDPEIERTFHPIDEKNAFLVLVNHHRNSVGVHVDLRKKIEKLPDPVAGNVVVKAKTAHGFEVEMQACEGAIFRLRGER